VMIVEGSADSNPHQADRNRLVMLVTDDFNDPLLLGCARRASAAKRTSRLKEDDHQGARATRTVRDPPDPGRAARKGRHHSFRDRGRRRSGAGRRAPARRRRRARGVAESALTGESLPVDEGRQAVSTPTRHGGRTDMVYMNTNVTGGPRGAGEFVVTRPGEMATEVGPILGTDAGAGAQRHAADAAVKKLTSQDLFISGSAVAILDHHQLVSRGESFDTVFTAAIFSLSQFADDPDRLPAVRHDDLLDGTQMLPGERDQKQLRSTRRSAQHRRINRQDGER